MKQQEVYGFIQKMKQLICLKCLKYKATLLENTEAENINGILKKATITVLLKYLSNFWRSFEMPVINWKVESKLKWTKYCVLPAAGADKTNDNSNNAIFTIENSNFVSKSNFIKQE